MRSTDAVAQKVVEQVSVQLAVPHVGTVPNILDVLGISIHFGHRFGHQSGVWI